MRAASPKTLGLYKPGPKVYACQKWTWSVAVLKRYKPIKKCIPKCDGLTDWQTDTHRQTDRHTHRHTHDHAGIRSFLADDLKMDQEPTMNEVK